MRARLLVFPIKGRNWCFIRSIDRSTSESQSSQSPTTFKQLWKNVSSSSPKATAANVELCVDFVANKVFPFSFFPSFLISYMIFIVSSTFVHYVDEQSLVWSGEGASRQFQEQDSWV